MELSRHFYTIVLIMVITMTLAVHIPHAKGETVQTDSHESTHDSGSEGMQTSSVPFLTLRDRILDEDAANYYGGERSFLQAGYCNVSRKPISPLKAIADKAPFHIPDEIVRLDSVTDATIEDFWQTLQQTSDGRAPVFYMHGFYISFDRGCRRAMILQESLGLQGRFVHFSWPSDGAILNYTHDEADLYWSVSPLHNVLAELTSRFGVGKPNLVAHSLGARGVMLALVLLAQAQHDKPLFNQVVLIAPDIDVGIFNQYLTLIRPLARNMTVYVSDSDSPLALSRQVHGYPRLGEAGEHLDRLDLIEIIDLSDIPPRKPSGHVYHLYQSLVTEDLDQLINENKTAAERKNLKQVSENQWRFKKADSTQ
jgi:esterase/lipase superfamily enzyme